LRFDDGLTDGIAFNGLEVSSEGIKMGLDSVLPIGIIGKGIASSVIGSDGDTVFRGLSWLLLTEFKGEEDGILDIIRDTAKML
jgi:hypothetical protein